MNKIQLIFHWLRWASLIPISVGSIIIISALVDFLANFLFPDKNLTEFTHAVTPFVSSFLSVIVAMIVAPKHKLSTVILIYCLWLLVLLVWLIIIAFKIELYGQEIIFKDGGMATSMIICGLSLSYYLIFIKRLRNPHEKTLSEVPAFKQASNP